MNHSITAKYAARPAASFPRPSLRSRERHLGLRSTIVFRAASAPVTVLRGETTSSLARIRGGSRAITPTQARRTVSGHLRPIVSMTWARSLPVGWSSAATAPWLA